jgi:hypothetical protein
MGSLIYGKFQTSTVEWNVTMGSLAFGKSYWLSRCAHGVVGETMLKRVVENSVMS